MTSEGCGSTIAAYADQSSVSAISGIFDLDTRDNGAGSPAPALFVSNCSDLGLAGFTNPTATTITPPQNAMTVAAAYGTSSTGVTVYGVVTAVSPWTSTGTLASGSIYIQDAASGTPAIHSGTEVYFTKTYAASYGTAPAVGDVVAVTGLSWSPYEGVNEFAVSSTTTVTKLGTSPLPAAVSITPAQAAQSSYVTSSGYEGMRVTVSGGPFTVNGSATSQTCPTQLQYTPGG